MNVIAQDPDSVGAGIRTISLRLVGTEEAKAELESLGEDVSDFVVGTQSKIADSVKSFTQVASNGFKGFSILDDNGNYKSTYEIMQGIADIYDEIVETDKKYGTNKEQGLLELIAGKNRSNIAASILQNGDVLKSVYEDAQKSDGSAQQELDSYLESISGKLEKLKNSWQELWYSSINSELVKSVVDLGTGFLNLANNIGGVNTAILALSSGSILKNVGRPKMFGLFQFADSNKCSLGY